MKILGILLLGLSLSAVAETQKPRTPSDMVGEERAISLDEIYKELDGYCSGTGHHADLVKECVKVKKSILIKYKHSMEIRVNGKMEEGDARADSKYCVIRLRKHFIKMGYDLTGLNTCSELEEALLVNEPAPEPEPEPAPGP